MKLKKMLLRNFTLVLRTLCCRKNAKYIKMSKTTWCNPITWRQGISFSLHDSNLKTSKKLSLSLSSLCCTFSAFRKQRNAGQNMYHQFQTSLVIESFYACPNKGKKKKTALEVDMDLNNAGFKIVFEIPVCFMWGEFNTIAFRIH